MMHAGFSALQRAENSSILLPKTAPNGLEQFQCSSASRKFLNRALLDGLDGVDVFQCSSASRKFLNRAQQCNVCGVEKVSVLFSEPKIPQLINRRRARGRHSVSVLFSEPKIPQSSSARSAPGIRCRFSALQRAENSSILPCPPGAPVRHIVSVLFSEPKIPQFLTNRTPHRQRGCGFSALQRAENSSINTASAPKRCCSSSFQCSSASRKFLNHRAHLTGYTRQCVSVLFSEPKIPQFVRAGSRLEVREVSVLFSEPKIPQSVHARRACRAPRGFSALQRAENSSIDLVAGETVLCQGFSALQRAENSSICTASARMTGTDCVSVLFSEPKIPQCMFGIPPPRIGEPFQCSSASRKFLNCVV